MSDVSIALVVRSTDEALDEDSLPLLETTPAIDWHLFAPAEGIVRVQAGSPIKLHDLRAATSRTACWLQAATWLVTFTQSSRLVIAATKNFLAANGFAGLVHAGQLSVAEAVQTIPEDFQNVFPQTRGSLIPAT